jgi:cyclohexyl-isocyanide hydratase
LRLTAGSLEKDDEIRATASATVRPRSSSTSASANPVNERVVVDGAWVFAAGVTAVIDGALRLTAELRGEEAAQAIQLHMVYAPEPPFDSGRPETAPTAILEQARRSVADITARREQTARRVAAQLGVAVPSANGTRC